MAREDIGGSTEEEQMQIGIAKSILLGVRDLCEKHVAKIAILTQQSDNKKASVGFPVKIDCSSSVPIIDIGIRFTKTVTDRRKYSLADINQPSLFDGPDGDRPNDNVDEDQAPKKRGRRGKEAASEGQGESEGSEA